MDIWLIEYRVNHILDYSKMSQATKAQRRQQSSEEASRHESSIRKGVSAGEEETSVDLARLTEEYDLSRCIKRWSFYS